MFEETFTTELPMHEDLESGKRPRFVFRTATCRARMEIDRAYNFEKLKTATAVIDQISPIIEKHLVEWIDGSGETRTAEELLDHLTLDELVQLFVTMRHGSTLTFDEKKESGS